MKNIWKTTKWLHYLLRPFLLVFLGILLLSVFISLSGVGMAAASKIMVDAVIAMSFQKAAWTGLIFAAIIAAKIGLEAYLSMLTLRTEESISDHLQQLMYQHLSMTQWTDYHKLHSGDILTRLTYDVDRVVSGLITIIPEIVSLGVGFLAAFLMLLYLDPILAVLAFALGPLSIILSRIFGRRLKKLHEKTQEAESNYVSYLQESLQHMTIIKTFCYEKENRERVKQLQKERFRLTMQKNRLGIGAGSVMSAGYWIGYFLSFAWGARSLSLGEASFGMMTAFLQLVEQVQSPIVGLAESFSQLISLYASAQRLMDLERLPLEKQYTKLPSVKAAGISFQNVSFQYEDDTPVLKDISVQIQAGETIGIIGTSGEGKTTLIRLILSLVKPTTGDLYFTIGQNKKMKGNASCRAFISYVPQGNTLFSGTIEDNLRMGCIAASREELMEALQSVDALDFIERLPEGLGTVIGEHGLGLSEGQAQRIAIARALLRRTPILILDEATSALDTVTEQRILNTIAGNHRKQTCILITHRSSLLDICDRILRIEEGMLYEIKQSFTLAQAIEVI